LLVQDPFPGLFCVFVSYFFLTLFVLPLNSYPIEFQLFLSPTSTASGLSLTSSTSRLTEARFSGNRVLIAPIHCSARNLSHRYSCLPFSFPVFTADSNFSSYLPPLSHPPRSQTEDGGRRSSLTPNLCQRNTVPAFFE